MIDEEEIEIGPQKKKVEEEEAPRRRPKKLKIPRRTPSVVVPPKKIVYITADMNTCKECVCFPKEDPYVRNKKINPCQFNPLTLYELASAVVDGLKYPTAFDWSPEGVADWMEHTVGLPQYRDCILDNKIDGKRLLLLEDPSRLPQINIRYFDHIQIITKKIREKFKTDFERYFRCNLPLRKPLTYCTMFKARTGPTWGIRQNWTRSDILRWMKIIDNDEFKKLDHWDLVWWRRPICPHTKFAKINRVNMRDPIPHYIYRDPGECREYMQPRRFRVHQEIPPEATPIWLEHRPGSPIPTAAELAREAELAEIERRKWRPTVPKPSRLDPPKIGYTSFEGLSGAELLLLRRLMPKKKFFVM